MKFTVMDGAETDKCMIHSKKKKTREDRVGIEVEEIKQVIQTQQKE